MKKSPFTTEGGLYALPRRRRIGTPARIAIDQFIRRHATRNRTLDLGAGQSPYQSLFPNRIALDRVFSHGLHVQGDAAMLPFRDETFDCVLCTELLEHVMEPKMAVQEMWRILKPGGMVILTTRFCYPIHMAPHDFWRFTRHGLIYLFRGWEIKAVEEDTTAFGAVGTLLQEDMCGEDGWLWEPFRFFWRVIWRCYRLWTRARAARGVLRPSGVAPAGYLLVARKPAPNQQCLSQFFTGERVEPVPTVSG